MRQISDDRSGIYECSPELYDELVDLIYQMKRLRALKRYIDLTGVSLEEGRQYIRVLYQKLRAADPGAFPPEDDY